MKNKTRLIVIAFMISIILFLPVTQAISIENVVTQTSSGSNGVIKEEEDVKFLINIDKSSQNVDPQTVSEYIYIEGIEKHPVSSCSLHTSQENIIVCQKTLKVNVTEGSSLYYYNILIVKDPKYEGKIYVDNTPPSEINLNANQKADKLNITISAKDTAGYGLERCAGLKKAEITLEDSEGDSSDLGTINFQGDECTETKSKSLSLPQDLFGIYTICAKVYDKFDYNSTSCINLDIDLSEPVIKDDTLDIYTQEENLLEALLPDGGRGMVAFKAEQTSNIDESSSYVIFNENKKDINCQSRGNEIFCKTPLLDINSGENTVKAVLLDNTGNEAISEKTLIIPIDEEGPHLRDFQGKYVHDQKLYLPSSTTIQLIFREDGAGMYDAQTGFYLGERAYSASNCSKQGNEWWCDVYVETSSVSDGVYPIDIFPGTADDLGNKWETSETGFHAVVDKKKPVIDEIDIKSIGAMGKTDIVYADSTVRLNITYDDLSPVRYKVNFSNLGKPGSDEIDPSYNYHTGKCNDGECLIESSMVGSGGIGKVELKLIDKVENTAEEEFRIKVLSKDEKNNWKGDVKLMPSSWDREISRLGQKAMAEITFQPINDAENIVSVDFIKCTTQENLSDGEGGMEYISDYSLSYSSEDHTKQYLNFRSKQTDFFIDKVKLNCEFDIASYGQTSVYPSEIEKVPVEIGLYNDPADKPDESLQKKIDSAVEETEGMLGTLDQIYSWVQWAEKICKIYNTIRGIITALDTLLGGLGKTFDILKSNPLTAAAGIAGEASTAPTCLGQETVEDGMDKAAKGIIGKFCGFVNCEYNICGGLGGMDIGSKSTSFFGIGEDNTHMKTTTDGEEVRRFDKNSLGSNEITGAFAANDISIWDPDGIPYMICHLCIPGLLRKFHDYRQIRCSYVNCLVDQAQSGVLNEAACDEIRSSAECKFWAGELFSMMPFAYMWDNILDTIASMMADVFGGILGVTQFLTCEKMCWFKTGKTACSMSYNINKYVSAITTLWNIGNSLETLLDFSSEDACDTMDEKLKELKQQNKDYNERVSQRVGGTSPSPQSGSQYTLPDGYGGNAAN